METENTHNISKRDEETQIDQETKTYLKKPDIKGS